MRPKQARPRHLKRTGGKNKQYSPTALTNAYMLVKDDGFSVRKAAATCRVPESTLRDRTLGVVDIDTVAAGTPPLFKMEEEVILVNHFKKMADFGYGYTRQECVDIASDYALQLGKRTKDKPLSIKWFRGFIKRWPELKVVKPRNLEFARAKMASAAVVKTYFENLKETLVKHNLLDKPHLIFNVDEKGISVEHKAPFVVASASHGASAVTSGKGKTITLLGCGSASGQAIPPYLIFPGQRMRQDLLQGATAGAVGTVTETGWSNGLVFREYLATHFLKFVPGRSDQKILLIMDGHKSHVSVGLCEWAFQHGIIMFILPPHCSHILQPMDVGCFGPFQRLYNSQCHKLMRQISATINRYNVCQIACYVYQKALSAENLQSAFRKSGIYPFNNEVIPSNKTLPAEVFRSSEDQASVEDVTSRNEAEDDTELDMFEKKERQIKKIKSENASKPRKTMSKIVAGKEITEIIIDKMNEHNKNQKQKPCITKQVKHKMIKTKAKKVKHAVSTNTSSPTRGPSCINLIHDSDSDNLSDSLCEDSELCCQCGKYTPDEVSRSASLIFTKWGQCDKITGNSMCNHWVHLAFCSPIRVLRRGDTFICPCCDKEE